MIDLVEYNFSGDEAIGSKCRMNSECFEKVKDGIKALKDLGAFSIVNLLFFIDDLYENGKINEAQSDELCLLADPTLSFEGFWGDFVAMKYENPLLNIAMTAAENA